MSALTKAEITAKCTAAQIASRNESAIAATVNVGRTTTVKVPVLDVKAYLHQNNLWLKVKAAAASTVIDATQQSALALIEFASSGVSMMDVTLPVVGAQLGYLVTGAVISQANKDAIIAMAAVPDPVSPFDVAVALQGA